MAAATAARKTKRKLSCYDMYWDKVVAAATTIYHGTWVGLNASGLLVNADAAVFVLGRAACANGISAAAGETVRVDQGIFNWVAAAGLTIANVGQYAYADDNQTASMNVAAGPVGGVIVDVDSDGAWILSGFGVGSPDSPTT